MLFMDVDFCTELGPIVTLAKNAVKLLQWGIPIILIILGMLDLGKAVMAGKEDEMKSAQKLLIKRLIYAVAIFFVVTIVYFAMGLVGSSDWKDCWKGTGSTSNDNTQVIGYVDVNEGYYM